MAEVERKWSDPVIEDADSFDGTHVGLSYIPDGDSKRFTYGGVFLDWLNALFAPKTHSDIVSGNPHGTTAADVAAAPKSHSDITSGNPHGTRFLTLSDTDDVDYTGKANYGAVVNAGATGIILSSRGQLVNVAGPDANTTMQVGKRYIVNTTGWTSARTYTTPAAFAVGDKVAIKVVNSSTNKFSDFDLLIKTPAGDTVDLVPFDVNPYTRLVHNGDAVELDGVTANTGWAFLNLELVPEYAEMIRTTVQSIPPAGITPVAFDSEFTRGMIPTLGGGANVQCRRGGTYFVQVFNYMDPFLDNVQVEYTAEINAVANTFTPMVRTTHGATATVRESCMGYVNLAAGDTVRSVIAHNDAAPRSTRAVGPSEQSKMVVREVI